MKDTIKIKSYQKFIVHRPNGHNHNFIKNFYLDPKILSLKLNRDVFLRFKLI